MDKSTPSYSTYYRNCIKRAAKESAVPFGGHWARAIWFSLFLWLVGFLADSTLRGLPAATGELTTRMLWDLVPAIVLILGWLGVYLFRAPVLLAREHERTIAKLNNELTSLNTPKVSMDFEEVKDSPDGGVSTAIIVLTGLSDEPQRVELYCVDVRPMAQGSTTISIRANEPGIAFTLHRGESHRVEAIRYDWTETLADINVLVPCKLSANDIPRGREFLVLFGAYGRMPPVQLQLTCSLGQHRNLHVEKVMTRSIADTQDSLSQAT